MQIDLNYPEPVTVKLEPAKTMLLIVDMENEDAHPEGKRYMGQAVEEIIPKIADLRRRVREAGGLVVHTQSVPQVGDLRNDLLHCLSHVAFSFGVGIFVFHIDDQEHRLCRLELHRYGLRIVQIDLHPISPSLVRCYLRNRSIQPSLIIFCNGASSL